MKWVLLDFETSSSVDLKKSGSRRYAEDPTTEIICLGYSIDGIGEIVNWGNALPYDPVRAVDMRPGSLEAAVADPAVMFVAHNAGFEKDIWREIMIKVYGWPDIPNERWHDTMAICAQKAIPLQLEAAAKVLRLPVQKDMEGRRITLGLSKPNKKGYYDRSEATLARVYQYNGSDVQAEVAAARSLGGFQGGERDVWLLDQTINERGVRIDLEFVSAARKIVREAEQPLRAEFNDRTGLNPGQRDAIKAWLEQHGLKVDNLQKGTIDALLGTDDEDDDDLGDEDSGDDQVFSLSADVRRVLELRRLLSGAAVKKLNSIEAAVCADGRVRRLLQYHAAGPGRWAGRLVQPQNFPRGSLRVGGEPPPPDEVAAAILTGDWRYVQEMYGPAMEVVASGLRGAIVAAGSHKLVVGDFATIEARIVLALAGQHDKTAIMASGKDIYCDMASAIYKQPVDKKKDPEKRQTGKNSVLGLGFQMGWRKFQSRYCPDEPDDFAKEVVTTYRESWAPAVPKVWAGLEEAAIRAVWDKRPVEAYGVLYQREGGWLTARLPSGRKLFYFNPQPCRKAMPWDPTDIRPAWTCQAMKQGRWITRDMYGGLETENVVQALARDLMVAAMFRCEKENLPIVLTVHDEIVAEPLTKYADHEMLRQLMCERPAWAVDMQIPVAAECWQGGRYAKK